MTEAFTLRRQVEFNHCDPAGIVFYPRYFEMISALTERFFADGVGHSWARMGAEEGAGTPLGAINIRFLAPSRLEDWLDFKLQIKALGSASATFALTCSCAGEARFTGQATVIHARLSQGHSSPWPDTVRRAMARYLLTPPDTQDS